MRYLTVLYDANCELCRNIRAWLLEQPTFIELRFIPAASEAAVSRFPGLDHQRTVSELTVVSDTGAVYYGSKGWLVCLWALREYRLWSFRLARPDLLPTSRRFIAWLSRNRYKFAGISKFLAKEQASWQT